MATRAEVETALQALVAKLHALDAETRGKHAVDRTVSCAVHDLGVVYTARLTDQGLSDVTTDPCGPAQVRLRVGSDDLLALVEGRLHVTTAWATGRVRVDASVLDLLKLRSLL